MDPSWLGSLTKPFANLFNPLTERIGNRLGRRKPQLHIHTNPAQSFWTLAHNGPNEVMQIVIRGGFNHDDSKATLFITDVYPVGTHSEFGFLSQFAIPPGQIIAQQLMAMVSPVIAVKGQAWMGKIEFIDQFHRKYRSQKLVLKWAGRPDHPEDARKS